MTGERVRRWPDRDARLVWPLLALGERVHAGRGATVGLGCYRIIAGEEGECGSPFVPG